MISIALSAFIGRNMDSKVSLSPSGFACTRTYLSVTGEQSKSGDVNGKSSMILRGLSPSNPPLLSPHIVG